MAPTPAPVAPGGVNAQPPAPPGSASSGGGFGGIGGGAGGLSDAAKRTLLVDGVCAWALIDGYPWWPTVVRCRQKVEQTLQPDDKLAPETRDNRLVEFFNDNDHVAVVELGCLQEYTSARHLADCAGEYSADVAAACAMADAYIRGEGPTFQRDSLARASHTRPRTRRKPARRGTRSARRVLITGRPRPLAAGAAAFQRSASLPWAPPLNVPPESPERTTLGCHVSDESLLDIPDAPVKHTPLKAEPKRATPKAGKVGHAKKSPQSSASPKSLKSAAQKTAPPKSTTLKDTKPKVSTPKTTTPKTSTPKSSTPKAATLKAASQKATTPKESARKGVIPKSSTPRISTGKVGIAEETIRDAVPTSAGPGLLPKKTYSWGPRSSDADMKPKDPSGVPRSADSALVANPAAISDSSVLNGRRTRAVKSSTLPPAKRPRTSPGEGSEPGSTILKLVLARPGGGRAGGSRGPAPARKGGDWGVLEGASAAMDGLQGAVAKFSLLLERKERVTEDVERLERRQAALARGNTELTEYRELLETANRQQEALADQVQKRLESLREDVSRQNDRIRQSDAAAVNAQARLVGLRADVAAQEKALRAATAAAARAQAEADQLIAWRDALADECAELRGNQKGTDGAK